MTSPAILTLGRPRRRLARVPLLFRARDCEDEDGIFALSYGKRVGLVHTRSGATGLATMADENGMLLRVPSDWPRLSWEMTTAGSRVRALLLETSRVNLLARSEEFGSWNDLNTCTVTANTHQGAGGALTADTLTATMANSERWQSAAFTGDGEKCASIYLRKGTSGVVGLRIRDTTASVNRHYVHVTLNADGVPTLSTFDGAGTRYAPVYLERIGLWRIPFSATGVVAANANRLTILPDPVSGVGSVIVFGAQAEDAIVPSSYIRTVAAAVTRAGDSAYFPLLLTPRAMTAYVHGVERGTRFEAARIGTTARLLQISSAANANPKVLLGAFTNGRYQFQTFDASAVQSVSGLASDLGNPAYGQSAEFRGVLSAAGSALCGVALDGGTEVFGGVGTAVALAAAWSDTRLYLNDGGNTGRGLFAFRSVVVDAGTQELDELRELVEVA